MKVSQTHAELYVKFREDFGRLADSLNAKNRQISNTSKINPLEGANFESLMWLAFVKRQNEVAPLKKDNDRLSDLVLALTDVAETNGITVPEEDELLKGWRRKQKEAAQ